MKRKAILFTFLFSVLLNSLLQGMDKEIIETAQIIAEMCYRKKVDLKNKTLNLCQNLAREEMPFTLSDYDADNIFKTAEWAAIYPNALQRLVEIWDNNGIHEAEKIFAKDSISLFEMISHLQPNSKKMLLKNLSKYACSPTNFIINSFLFLASCSCTAVSGYLFFNTESPKLKLATVVYGLASFTGLYFAKNAKNVLNNYLWWNSCANFQKAMNLCKN